MVINIFLIQAEEFPDQEQDWSMVYRALGNDYYEEEEEEEDIENEQDDDDDDLPSYGEFGEQYENYATDDTSEVDQNGS